jgi:hypothetical protein
MVVPTVIDTYLKVDFFIMLAPAAIRVLRGFGGFLANGFAIFVGVGVLKNLSAVLVKLFTHSIASIVLTEWSCSAARSLGSTTLENTYGQMDMDACIVVVFVRP